MTWRQRLKAIPLSVFAGALAVGFVAVALTSTLLDSRTPVDTAAPAPPVNTATGEAPLDFRWRSGRADGSDCIGTLELTSGTAKPALLVGSVMDSAGAIRAADSAQVASTVSRLLVEFRFRRIRCDEIRDWQLQVMTPKGRAN